ncbi:MAG: hypothetical protein KDA21_01850 [Phycisphaerales bacterium]|nr:hypothetical protein [Phycisphaerales bacterium]
MTTPRCHCRLALLALLCALPLGLGPVALASPTGDDVRRVVDDAARAATQVADAVEVWLAEQVRLATSTLAPETGVFVLRSVAVPETESTSLAWLSLEDAGALPERLVLLVHGLDEPGDIWDDLAPVLVADGHHVARFEYPNDQDPALSADSLHEALADLRARGVVSVSLVCHSMGGLVARDVLTREGFYGGDGAGHDDLPAVAHFITVGTPNHGSPFASLQPIAEAREQVSRWLDDPANTARVSAFQHDGTGEAAVALAEGSDYLEDLNGRGLPRDVEMTVIIGRVTPPQAAATIRVVTRSALASRLLPSGFLRVVEKEADAAVTLVGDGVVPVDSARLEGVSDTIVLQADHRAMLRLMPIHREAYSLAGVEFDQPPAIPIIVDRLGTP